MKRNSSIKRVSKIPFILNHIFQISPPRILRLLNTNSNFYYICSTKFTKYQNTPMSAVITQWRNNNNNSGEIDVFEAARYFSGGADQNPINTVVPPPPPPQRVLACRISLEMPKNPYSNLTAAAAMDDGGDQKRQEKKKYKQPSSPGGKLAGFLNSLFNQTTSKKTTNKKLMKKTSMPVKSGSSNNDLEVERKRRSSISHFRITTTSDSSKKSTYANTITATPMKSSPGVSAPSRIINGVDYQKRTISDNNIISYMNNTGFGFSDRSSTIMNRKFSDDDDDEDGAESDSSSDLFDLPNHDLDFCSASSGNLPVYGTTHMDRIRISAPISALATFL
ncbi:hypothetical protein ACP275_12G092100 [Erythranthe tilingii]